MDKKSENQGISKFIWNWVGVIALSAIAMFLCLLLFLSTGNDIPGVTN